MKQARHRNNRDAAGVALVTAIFLLVVLAGLAVAVVSLTTTQRAGAAQDELGNRAYQAARAGLEWALYDRLEGTLAGSSCPATSSFALPPGTTLSAFTVTVICEQPFAGYGSRDANDVTRGGVRITVTACNGPLGTACPNATPGPDYVQRVVTAQL